MGKANSALRGKMIRDGSVGVVSQIDVTGYDFDPSMTGTKGSMPMLKRQFPAFNTNYKCLNILDSTTNSLTDVEGGIIPMHRLHEWGFTFLDAQVLIADGTQSAEVVLYGYDKVTKTVVVIASISYVDGIHTITTTTNDLLNIYAMYVVGRHIAPDSLGLALNVNINCPPNRLY